MYDETLGEMAEGFSQNAKGVLIGGGVAQLGVIGTKLAVPSMAKWRGLLGTALGVAAGYLMARNPANREQGHAAIAAALVVGLPRQIEDYMIGAGMLKGDDALLGAYSAEMGAVPGLSFEGESPVQLLDSGSGSTGLLGAVVPENLSDGMSADVDVQGAAFGSTGFGG